MLCRLHQTQASNDTYFLDVTASVPVVAVFVVIANSFVVVVVDGGDGGVMMLVLLIVVVSVICLLDMSISRGKTNVF